jgi:hypothetical protein
VALAQGDTCQALHHYGELVSKALMGRGSAEHWAYAEYGWLLFKVRAVMVAQSLHVQMQHAGVQSRVGIVPQWHAFYP